MDELFKEEEKYRKYAHFSMLLGLGAMIVASIFTALLINSGASPLTVLIVFMIGPTIAGIGIKINRKHEALARKIITEDIKRRNEETISFSMHGDLKKDVDRIAEALGISNVEVVGGALSAYITIADQFATAKGQERIVEITDGKTLRKIFNIAEVLPHHKSHLKVIK